MISDSMITRYCCEPIENIENYWEAVNDTAEIWDCHHKDEIDKNMSKQELIEAGLYWGVVAERLIFLKRCDHNTIHREANPDALKNWIKAGANANRGRQKTEEEKIKISEGLKEYYRTHENPHTGTHHSEETKEKIRKARENLVLIITEEGRKGLSEAGKKAALVKKCYINENGEEVWMRPSLKALHHKNWVEKC